MLERVPGLEELGMVGEALSTVYSNANKWLSFQRLVNDYQQQKATVPGTQQRLYSIFNPENPRTEYFFQQATGRFSHMSLTSVVECILQGDSIPQFVFAEGISDEGLNLPPRIYLALEERHLPKWRTLNLSAEDDKIFDKSLKDHCRTLFGGYSRYIAALSKLEAVMSSLKVPV